MTDDRAVAAATQLMRLGVSNAGIVDLLAHHPIETIERQLRLLPARKARRPEAFIIDAIRHDYSAPNPHRHEDTTHPARKRNAVDQGPERALGRDHADAQGHGAQSVDGPGQSDHRVEP